MKSEQGNLRKMRIRYNGKILLSGEIFDSRKNMKMVSTKTDVLEALEKNKTKLHTFGVRRYSLFGSFLFDQATVESDVDLLVEFEPEKKTFMNFCNLAFFLEELLGRRVEIVTIESLSPHIGPHILREVEYVTVSA